MVPTLEQRAPRVFAVCDGSPNDVRAWLHGNGLQPAPFPSEAPVPRWAMRLGETTVTISAGGEIRVTGRAVGPVLDLLRSLCDPFWATEVRR